MNSKSRNSFVAVFEGGPERFINNVVNCGFEWKKLSWLGDLGIPGLTRTHVLCLKNLQNNFENNLKKTKIEKS